MDYDKTNAESILHAKGRVCFVLHVDGMDRAEKDVVRAAASDPYSDVAKLGKDYVALLINEEPSDDPVGDFDEEQELDEDPTVEDDDPDAVRVVEEAKFSGTVSDEPSMDELRALTVQELKNLADKDRVDLSGLKLKDDILGRMAAHFGLDPAS
jgi:hypothetical protein